MTVTVTPGLLAGVRPPPTRCRIRRGGTGRLGPARRPASFGGSIDGPALTFLTDGVNAATRMGFMYCTLYFGMQYFWYREERKKAEEEPEE